jgi:hypothetical protein
MDVLREMRTGTEWISFAWIVLDLAAEIALWLGLLGRDRGIGGGLGSCICRESALLCRSHWLNADSAVGGRHSVRSVKGCRNGCIEANST